MVFVVLMQVTRRYLNTAGGVFKKTIHLLANAFAIESENKMSLDKPFILNYNTLIYIDLQCS